MWEGVQHIALYFTLESWQFKLQVGNWILWVLSEISRQQDSYLELNTDIFFIIIKKKNGSSFYTQCQLFKCISTSTPKHPFRQNAYLSLSISRQGIVPAQHPVLLFKKIIKNFIS